MPTCPIFAGPVTIKKLKIGLGIKEKSSGIAIEVVKPQRLPIPADILLVDT